MADCILFCKESCRCKTGTGRQVGIGNRANKGCRGCGPEEGTYAAAVVVSARRFQGRDREEDGYLIYSAIGRNESGPSGCGCGEELSDILISMGKCVHVVGIIQYSNDSAVTVPMHDRG